MTDVEATEERLARYLGSDAGPVARSMAADGLVVGDQQDIDEAAHIEALDAAAEEGYQEGLGETQAERITALRAENDSLRNAGARFVAWVDAWVDCPWMAVGEPCDHRPHIQKELDRLRVVFPFVPFKATVGAAAPALLAAPMTVERDRG